VTTKLSGDWYDVPLPRGVVLGERTWVYSSYAFLHCQSELDPCVRIGNDTGVYDGSIFELGPNGSVEIGRFCNIVAAIIRADGPVVVEDYALVSWNVYISDLTDDVATPPGAEPSRTAQAGPLVIGRNSWVCAGAILLRGASIGEEAIVGAGAVVREPVRPGAIVAGNPARVVAQR